MDHSWLARARAVAPYVNDTEIQRPSARPAPRPPRCTSRQLRSPLLSAQSEQNLIRDIGRFKLPRNVSLGYLQKLAWRGHAHILSRRHRACAVVGSSSKLLDFRDGDAIDAADLVFRVNHPLVPPILQPHIGSRTDVHVDPLQLAARRVVYHNATSVQIFTCTSNHDFPVCLHFAPRTDVRDGRLADGRWDKAAPALDVVARMLAASMHYKRGAFDRPTTGFMAVMVALHICDETRLYGFGMSDRQPCAKYIDEEGRYGITNASDCGGAQSGAKYGSDIVHNYDAEQAWLRHATRNYSRSITCEVLPNLALNLSCVGLGYRTAFALDTT